ncbi:MAG: hypothetical protein AB1726_14425 [Planctomycetota bacterium]
MADRRTRRRGIGPGAALSLLALGMLGPACGPDSDSSPAPAGAFVPRVLDAAALAEYVRPTAAHPAVLVNLWASW